MINIVPEKLCNCPICDAESTKTLLSLCFRDRLGLPEKIALAFCANCNFAYTSPRDPAAYQRYYASTTNDQLGDVYEISTSEAKRYQAQLNAISSLLDQPGTLKVLDIGCGRAGLLRTLQQRYPQHQYHGSDPNCGEEKCDANGIRYNRSWETISLKFALIILSHVLEHIIDLDAFSSIIKLLTADGSFYVELPDSARYADFPRREYLYYIDRLHINHFTSESLAKMLNKWGLVVTRRGNHDFEYKDGNLYPACYAIASFKGEPTWTEQKSEPLLQSLAGYFKSEAERAQTWQQMLSPKEEIIVYGFGDNFFRSSAPGGPLAGYKPLAIVDMRWRELLQTPYAAQYHFMDLTDAIKNYGSCTFVLTISWGAESIKDKLLDMGAKRVLVL